MIRIEGRVQYEDGTEVDFTAGPMVLAEWELYAHQNRLPVDHEAVPMLHTAFIAWRAVTRGKKIAFEDWRDKVASLEVRTAEAIPTTAA